MVTCSNPALSRTRTHSAAFAESKKRRAGGELDVRIAKFANDVERDKQIRQPLPASPTP